MSKTHKPKIGIVEDDPTLRKTLATVLRAKKFEVKEYASGDQLLLELEKDAGEISLIISDLNLGAFDGIQLCKMVREKFPSPYLPFIMLTGDSAEGLKVRGIQYGADDYISKPVNAKQLVAKINSLLALRKSHEDTLHALNTTRGEKEKLVNLKKFLSPNVAEALTTGDMGSILTRRQNVVSIVFVDLRGFTNFSVSFTPADVMGVLESYYKTVGEITLKYQGTMGHLAGDGIMVFFNDPKPIKDHRLVAARACLEIKQELDNLVDEWDKNEFNLSFGIGLSFGETTIGGIGFDRYFQYTIIGSATNLASRLCALARGEILIPRDFAECLGPKFFVDFKGDYQLKGISETVPVCRLVGERGALLKSSA
jgi:adenylate cyclase